MNSTGKLHWLVLAALVVLRFADPAIAQKASKIFKKSSPSVLFLVSIGQPDVKDLQEPAYIATGTGFLVETGGQQWIVTNKVTPNK